MKVLKGLFSAVTFIFILQVALAAFGLTSSDGLIGLGLSPEVANYISSKLIKVDSNGSLVLPVASGEKLSVTVAGTEELSVNATAVTIPSASFTVTAGDVTATNGEIISSTSGKTLALQEATAGAKCMGTVTANGTTAVTTATTCATTGSRIFLTRSADNTGTTTAACWATNISNGVSFDIDCDAADDSTYHWLIIHEAA